jgi:hypothetical protein
MKTLEEEKKISPIIDSRVKRTLVKLDNGDTYEGEWLEEYIDGFGILKNEQYIYEGEFKKNFIHGNGKLTYISGG